MKLVPIFVKKGSEDGLWSVLLEGESQNEFEKFFDLMNDIEWLHNFFGRNKADLNSGYWGIVSIERAVIRVVEEVAEMEDILYDYTEQGFFHNGTNLQNLFKPLNNFEYAITVHQKSKTSIRKGWLRLYAIRLAENCYLVTGGAIKLTLDMKRDHLQRELVKLERVKIFLRSNGIDYPEDLNIFKDE